MIVARFVSIVAQGGKLIDQALWAIIDEDRYRSKAVWGAKIS
jgi:hypothetical protein